MRSLFHNLTNSNVDDGKSDNTGEDSPKRPFAAVKPKVRFTPEKRKVHVDQDELAVCTAAHIDPEGNNEDRMEGWALHCATCPEHVLTSPPLLKATDTAKVEFLESADCANEAVTVESCVANDGTCMLNEIQRPTKGLVFLSPDMKESDAHEHVEQDLTKESKDMPSHMREIKEADCPKLRAGQDHVILNAWDQLLDDEDIILLLRENADNIAAFLKEKQANSCGLWRKGFVPVWTIKKHNLGEEHLDPVDFTKFQQHADNEAAALQRAQEQAGAHATGFHP